MQNSIKIFSCLLILSTLVLFSCKKKSKANISKEQKARIEKAKKLLAKAGYEDLDDFPKVTVLYNSNKLHEKVAVAIQNMWKEHLGINVELRNTEWKTYLQKLDQLDYQIARRGWIADYNDPFTFLQMFRTGNGNNDTGWGNKEYDRLLKKIRTTRNKKERQKYLHRAEEILMTEAPITPIYFYVTKELVKPEVKGWYQNERAIHPLRAAYRTDDKPLVIHLSDEIQSVDPGVVSGVPEHRVQNGLYEGLLRLDPKTLEPKPAVAKSWDVSEDGTRYTFYLRDCTWSDGKPVTAQDFVYSWRRVLKPETGSEYADILYYLKGAEAFNKDEISDPKKIGVKAKDDKTLVVELEHPTPFFLKLMTFFTYYPVRKDIIEEHGKDWTDPEHHIGNGAFTLEERVLNSHITLKKNENYWDAENVKQETIKFRPINKVTTAFNLYEKNEIHVMTTVPPNNIEQIKKRDDFHSTTYLGTYYYAFNTQAEPFDDARVRRALGLVINRERIVKKVTRAGEKPAYHYVPPTFDDYEHPRIDRVQVSE